jgi:hypothetical protein
MNCKLFYCLVLLTVFVFFASNSYAQTTRKGKWRWSFGVEPGLPTGAMHDYSNFELGGTLRAQYGLSDALALTFTSGYYNFFAKKLTIPGYGSVQPDDVGIIPVKAGIKVFFAKGFYVGAEAGAGFETPGGSPKLILSPNAGFATNAFDLGIRYEHFTQKDHSYGLLALRLASGF